MQSSGRKLEEGGEGEVKVFTLLAPWEVKVAVGIGCFPKMKVVGTLKLVKSTGPLKTT